MLKITVFGGICKSYNLGGGLCIRNRRFFMLNGVQNYAKLVVVNNSNKNSLELHSAQSGEKSKDLKLCKSAECTENLSKVCEGLLNQQILMELEAAFAYFSMACYFGRSEIALPGCQGYFLNMHQEEHEHAMMFTNYVLRRGGTVSLKNIAVPTITDWKCIRNALQESLKLEQKVKEKFNMLHCEANKQGDFDLEDYIAPCIAHQNLSICEITRLLSRAQMVENNTGEFLFDKMLFKSFVRQKKNNFMYLQGLEKWNEDDVYK